MFNVVNNQQLFLNVSELSMFTESIYTQSNYVPRVSISPGTEDTENLHTGNGGTQSEGGRIHNRKTNTPYFLFFRCIPALPTTRFCQGS